MFYYQSTSCFSLFNVPFLANKNECRKVERESVTVTVWKCTKKKTYHQQTGKSQPEDLINNTSTRTHIYTGILTRHYHTSTIDTISILDFLVSVIFNADISRHPSIKNKMKPRIQSIIRLFIKHLINCLIHQYIRMSFSCSVTNRLWYCELILSSNPQHSVSDIAENKRFGPLMRWT